MQSETPGAQPAGCFALIILTFVVAFVATFGVRAALHILGG